MDSNKRKLDERDETTTSSDDSNREKKRRKSKKKKKSHRKKKRTHDSESQNSSHEEDSRRRHREKKQKKHKKHKKRPKCGDDVDSGPQFGKYGILKREDFSRMQRALEVWLDEVKSISASVLPRRDLQNYFEEFREDFNTATLPHKKYYNFDAWEQEEWNKKSVESALDHRRNDEQTHKLLRRQEEASVKLDTETIADMKHQAALRTQMQVAFRTGDTETYERIRNRLNADRDTSVHH